MTEDLRPAPRGRAARIAVLDDYMGIAAGLGPWERLQGRAEVSFLTEAFRDADHAAEVLRPFDAVCLLRERTPMPATLLEALPELKAIAATGMRNRTLDLEAAARLGIAVMGTPSHPDGAFATSELAWGLIIALMRHIPEEAAAMRAGAWQTRLGGALRGRRLGIVGLGRLGTHMAEVARVFGMEVVAWSPNLTPERAEAAGVTAVTKEALLRSSDVVSLHLVLGPTTRGIIGGAELAQMRPDAILINTARGPLVDEAALVAALEAGTIRAAGLDVFDQEPMPADHPLRRLPNALLTPHLGYVVRETMAAFYADTVGNLESWLEGAPRRRLLPEG